jgi:hypothetical protein
LKLYARPEARTEHVLHTIRAFLVPAAIWTFFIAQTPHLALAVVVVATDQIVMIIDVAIEPRSRTAMGGIPPSEYMVHVLGVTFHVAAVVLAFLGRFSTFSDGSLPAPIRCLALGAFAGAVGAAGLHVKVMGKSA